MISIRSVTFNLGQDQISPESLSNIEKCSRIWDGAYPDIHTQRINFAPFSERFTTSDFQWVSELCDRTSIRWFNVPIDLFESDDPIGLCDSLYSLLANNGRSFGNVIGVKKGQFRTEFFKLYHDLIIKLSNLDYSGKDNFRLGLSFNIGEDCPFFPFTQSGNKQSFSIALEIAKDINSVCKEANDGDIACLRDNILSCLRPQIDKIAAIAKQIENKTSISFSGFDFSLAPSIDEMGSVITVLNSIGVYNFGKAGTMFATAFITDILKYLASQYSSVGFSGVMYSLLEDLELCKINNERGINIEQMLMVSTMCGCGLDMVPVSGDITQNEVDALCFEVGAISNKLHKPLGIRLVPIQQNKRGKTGYTMMKNDADFIANTRIVPLDTNIFSIKNNTFRFLQI